MLLRALVRLGDPTQHDVTIADVCRAGGGGHGIRLGEGGGALTSPRIWTGPRPRTDPGGAHALMDV